MAELILILSRKLLSAHHLPAHILEDIHTRELHGDTCISVLVVPILPFPLSIFNFVPVPTEPCSSHPHTIPAGLYPHPQL